MGNGNTPRTVSRSSVEGTDSASQNSEEITATPEHSAGTPETGDDELAELERAVNAERAASMAGEEARKNSVIEQSRRRGGDVNHDEANTVGQRAAEKARARALKGRPAGVYVLSTIKVAGEHGPIFAPPGYQLSKLMISKLGEKEIKRLADQELVDDLR